MSNTPIQGLSTEIEIEEPTDDWNDVRGNRILFNKQMEFIDGCGATTLVENLMEKAGKVISHPRLENVEIKLPNIPTSDIRKMIQSGNIYNGSDVLSIKYRDRLLKTLRSELSSFDGSLSEAFVRGVKIGIDSERSRGETSIAREDKQRAREVYHRIPQELDRMHNLQHQMAGSLGTITASIGQLVEGIGNDYKMISKTSLESACLDLFIGSKNYPTLRELLKVKGPRGDLVKQQILSNMTEYFSMDPSQRHARILLIFSGLNVQS